MVTPVPLGAASSLQPEKVAIVQTVPDQSSSQLICQDILIPSFNVVAKWTQANAVTNSKTQDYYLKLVPYCLYLSEWFYRLD